MYRVTTHWGLRVGGKNICAMDIRDNTKIVRILTKRKGTGERFLGKDLSARCISKKRCRTTQKKGCEREIQPTWGNVSRSEKVLEGGSSLHPLLCRVGGEKNATAGRGGTGNKDRFRWPSGVRRDREVNSVLRGGQRRGRKTGTRGGKATGVQTEKKRG